MPLQIFTTISLSDFVAYKTIQINQNEIPAVLRLTETY